MKRGAVGEDSGTGRESRNRSASVFRRRSVRAAVYKLPSTGTVCRRRRDIWLDGASSTTSSVAFRRAQRLAEGICKASF